MGLDQLLGIVEILHPKVVRSFEVVCDENKRSGQVNSLVAVWDRIFKVIGADASLIGGEAARSALEEIQSIFEKPKE